MNARRGKLDAIFHNTKQHTHHSEKPQQTPLPSAYVLRFVGLKTRHGTRFTQPAEYTWSADSGVKRQERTCWRSRQSRKQQVLRRSTVFVATTDTRESNEFSDRMEYFQENEAESLP